MVEGYYNFVATENINNRHNEARQTTQTIVYTFLIGINSRVDIVFIVCPYENVDLRIIGGYKNLQGY